MTREEAHRAIGVEFAAAAAARKVGNEGMVRVCARRAAGASIGFWLQEHPRQAWRGDAMSRLKALEEDETVPPDVRQAAGRLTGRVTRSFRSPHVEDPLEDARLIVHTLLGSDQV